MKRIGIVAVVIWATVLASVIVHAVWAHHALAASTAAYQPLMKGDVHRRMLIPEGRDAVLALTALIASVFVVRSARRTPSAILTVIALLAFLQWGVSFLTVLRHTDRTPFNTLGSQMFRFDLFWHTFLQPGAQCLLAGAGLVCGIMGVVRNRKTRDAEQPPAHVLRKAALSGAGEA